MGKLDQLQRRLEELEKARGSSAVDCIILAIMDVSDGKGVRQTPGGLASLDGRRKWTLRMGESMQALQKRALSDLRERPAMLIECPASECELA